MRLRLLYQESISRLLLRLRMAIVWHGIENGLCSTNAWNNGFAQTTTVRMLAFKIMDEQNVSSTIDRYDHLLNMLLNQYANL